MTEVLDRPNILDSQLTFDEAFVLWEGLKSGVVCGFREGLVERTRGLRLYTQDRVAAWDESTVTVGQIVKFETMYPLTADGQTFESTLLTGSTLQREPIALKELSGWRIKAGLLRRSSLDELPQLLHNVWLLPTPRPVERVMPMRLVGAGRPPLAAEIQVRGEESNDHYNQALERLAKKYGTNRLGMHKLLGAAYVPGLATPALARGHRQLGSVDNVTHWAEGIMEYAEIMKLGPVAQRRALATIAARTFLVGARRINAA